jgi:hypothetical protein
MFLQNYNSIAVFSSAARAWPAGTGPCPGLEWRHHFRRSPVVVLLLWWTAPAGTASSSRLSAGPACRYSARTQVGHSIRWKKKLFLQSLKETKTCVYIYIHLSYAIPLMPITAGHGSLISRQVLLTRPLCYFDSFLSFQHRPSFCLGRQRRWTCYGLPALQAEFLAGSHLILFSSYCPITKFFPFRDWYFVAWGNLMPFILLLIANLLAEFLGIIPDVYRYRYVIYR